MAALAGLALVVATEASVGPLVRLLPGVPTARRLNDGDGAAVPMVRLPLHDTRHLFRHGLLPFPAGRDRAARFAAAESASVQQPGTSRGASCAGRTTL